MSATTTSTVPAVYAAVQALFAAALPGVTVADGHPTQAQLPREIVILGDYELDSDQPVSRPDRVSRDEKYTITVEIWVFRPRGTTSEARARAEQLRVPLEDAIAGNPGLGGLAGLEHITWQGATGKAGQGAEGPAATVTCRLRVVARLS